MIAAQTETESQVIVHINYFTRSIAEHLRVWNHTFLQFKDSKI